MTDMRIDKVIDYSTTCVVGFRAIYDGVLHTFLYERPQGHGALMFAFDSDAELAFESKLIFLDMKRKGNIPKHAVLEGWGVARSAEQAVLLGFDSVRVIPEYAPAWRPENER